MPRSICLSQWRSAGVRPIGLAWEWPLPASCSSPASRRCGRRGRSLWLRCLLRPLSLTGAGALAINLSCAFMLARFRAHSGSLTRAAFLSARNDALANVAIIAAGIVTAVMLSGWPDLVVGLGIAALNADAARQVWRAAHEEHRAANA